LDKALLDDLLLGKPLLLLAGMVWSSGVWIRVGRRIMVFRVWVLLVGGVPGAAMVLSSVAVHT
jgi:hypothetical protein